MSFIKKLLKLYLDYAKWLIPLIALIVPVCFTDFL